MRLLRPVAPAALLLAAACLDVTEPTRDRLGLVTTRAYDNVGTPVLRGSAAFYRVIDLQEQPLVPTACQIYVFDPTPVPLSVPTIDAGTAVNFSVQGTSQPAARFQMGNFLQYEMATGMYLNFAAGDTVTVGIPGAVGGFEPTTIRTRLAEPFTVDPPPAYDELQPLTLTWTAAPASGSVMLVQMRFNASGVGADADAELTCVFPDIGSGDVPAHLAGQWVNAPEVGKAIVYTRVRESTVNFNARTSTRLLSLYEVPTPTLDLGSLVIDGSLRR